MVGVSLVHWDTAFDVVESSGATNRGEYVEGVARVQTTFSELATSAEDPGIDSIDTRTVARRGRPQPGPSRSQPIDTAVVIPLDQCRRRERGGGGTTAWGGGEGGRERDR